MYITFANAYPQLMLLLVFTERESILHLLYFQLKGKSMVYKRTSTDVRLLRPDERDDNGYPKFDGAPKQGSKKCLFKLAEGVASSDLTVPTEDVNFVWRGPNPHYIPGTCVRARVRSRAEGKCQATIQMQG